MGSNDRLMQAAKSSGIDRYIIKQQLGRGIWKPTSFEVQQFPRNDKERASNTTNKSTVKKNAADLIESLLGLIYLKVSFNAAYKVANEMGITLILSSEESNSIEGRTTNENKNLATFCQRFLNGYNFRQYDLLEEALTHPTCTHEQVPCYQRLEWVGDGEST
jgi:endoribonuclease Dicer